MVGDMYTEGNVVVVWGSTGNGKSTLANRLLGLEYDIKGYKHKTAQECFPVSAEAESMTRNTLIKKGYWFGDSTYGPVTVIDTPGLGDTGGPGQDSINIAEMITKLKSIEPGVHLFLLVFSSNNPRFDTHLQELVTLFDKMFSSQIWNNVALCFTNHAQDKLTRRKRASSHKAPDGSPDDKEKWVQDKVGGQFIEHIKKRLGMENMPKIPCFFVESVPDEDDDELIKAKMEEYFRHIVQFSGTRTPFSCADMVLVKRRTDELEDEVKKLVEMHTARQKELEELHDQLLLENQEKVMIAQNLAKAAQEKMSVLEELNKVEKEKSKLADSLKKESDEKAALVIREKIDEIERIAKEKAALIDALEKSETKAAENAKTSEQRIIVLEKKMNESVTKLQTTQNSLATRIAAKDAKEAQAELVIGAPLITKDNKYGKKWKDSTSLATLEVANGTGFVLEDFFYRIVHISNSHGNKVLATVLTAGLYLYNAFEDACSSETYECNDHYFAYQEFRIAKLQAHKTYKSSNSFYFVPHSKGFGNLYHYISVRIGGQDKATKKNWLVRLTDSHSGAQVRLTINPALVLLNAGEDSFTTRLKE